ncbi:hypothetical protein HYH03_000397 [Edaphochlamys debaryana]|uniref:Glycosyl transferase CAP10 domain-containing protein n=1 Tax=Edaphochlamys debaryana TaxID=47281 RepID=A0A835YHI4_9CHLO|nr:hypothetical protein HYH03_000397 [Edaphochlamys debaryana]|eukprot:KAG2501899.1 hypothetical protein HYH03_000397 [Edaphochlamys debaryana]
MRGPHRQLLAALLPTLVLLLATSLPDPAAAVRAEPPRPPPSPPPYALQLMMGLYPNHEWTTPVLASDEPRGQTWGPNSRNSTPHIPFTLAESDEDLIQLYDENLELDLAPWRRRNRSEVTVARLFELAERLPGKASQRMVLIKGGRLALLMQNSNSGPMLECEKPCDPVLDDLITDLRIWVAQSPQEWPDAVFFLNTADTSLCQAPGEGKRRSKTSLGPCPVPVLSLVKEWERHRDEDILVPITVGMHKAKPLYYFPWKKKIDRAIFRGTEYCHTRQYGYAPDTCSRTYFAHMTHLNPDWARFVDVGMVDNYTTRAPDGGSQVIPARGFVPMPELARFRYTLALDGITASSRLARLLSLNSVVLKQTSPWIEWYYRSLVPGTHYLSFWNHHRTDLLQVIKYVRHKSKYLVDVATHGQQFAYRYLLPNARRLYWRRVLHEYVKVFADMDEYVAKQVIPAGASA